MFIIIFSVSNIVPGFLDLPIGVSQDCGQGLAWLNFHLEGQMSKDLILGFLLSEFIFLYLCGGGSGGSFFLLSGIP